MTKGLFEYPQKAAFGRTLPKSKIYSFGKVTRRLKDLFAQEVEQIVWRYKLAPETINLPAGSGVTEIQIFGIELKPGVEELSDGLLQCIDNAIAFPIVFEITARAKDGDRLKIVTAHKRPSEADPTKWVVGEYFSIEWVPAHTPRSPLPVALSLAGLYEQMLHQLMPLAPRSSETLAELAERCRHTLIKQRELKRLEAELSREKQFNRKVEINARLRAMRAEVDAMIR